ncbi:hypothetical protein D9M72_275460 [compost metagenome]
MARAQPCPEMPGHRGQHAAHRLARRGRQGRQRLLQRQRAVADLQRMEAIGRQGIAGSPQPRHQLAEPVEHARAQPRITIGRAQRGGLGQVLPTGAHQPVRRRARAERAYRHRPQRREQHCRGAGQAGIEGAEEIRIEYGLHVGERRRVHRQQHRNQLEARARDQQADTEVGQRQHRGQRFKGVRVRHHQEQVAGRHQQADRAPAQEGTGHAARLVDGRKKAAGDRCHRDRAGAVLPAREDPQQPRAENRQAAGHGAEQQHAVVVVMAGGLRGRIAASQRRAGAAVADALLQRPAFCVQGAQALQLVRRRGSEAGLPVDLARAAIGKPAARGDRRRRGSIGRQPGGRRSQGLAQWQRHAVRMAAQRLQHAFQRRQQRHQHGHALAQRARMAQRVAALGVIGQLADQLVQRQDVGGEPVAAVVGARAAGEDVRCPGRRVGEPGGGAGPQRGRHLGREDDRAHQPGADDADHDFLDPGHGDIEDLRRCADGRQRDDRQGVGRQQVHIAARRALQQRQVHQHGDPQRDRTHQHDRHVDQLRHRGHRGGGTQHRAGHAVGRLGTGGAGQGMGNKVHRRHGPVRPRQAQRQRDI